MAKNLIEQLCSLKPGNRYRVEQALQHPWITGKLDDEIPLTHVHKFTKAIVNFEIDDKLRRLLNLVTFLSIVKNCESVRKVSTA